MNATIAVNTYKMYRRVPPATGYPTAEPSYGLSLEFVVISRDLFCYLVQFHQNFVNARNLRPPKERERLLENLIGRVWLGAFRTQLQALHRPKRYRYDR
jgi:hypothetical protein